MTTHLFVHIPKTAGTSFRLAAADAIGPDSIEYDYGEDAPQTTDLVRRHVYGDQDFWSFYKACERNGVRMVAGHMNCDRYVAGFGTASIVTFVREPIQRIASEYQHSVRHKKFPGTFRDFYTQPKMQNRLTRVFSKVPVWAAGFIGITERYNESLQLLNSLTGLGLVSKQENVGKRELHQQHQIGDAELSELRNLNARDLKNYRRCLDIFEQRLILSERGLAFTHGRLGQITPQKISGSAWWSGERRDEPVMIEILVNGRVEGRASATSFRPRLRSISVPRGGYVGFQLSIPLTDGDAVSCRVEETGQVLGEMRLEAGDTTDG